MWKKFFEKLEQLRKTGEPFVVATVVKVSGSTYRRPGARVLITESGDVSGLIGGGCFESDLIERAKQVAQNRKPATVSFDTTSPDDLIFGLGLGCTGIAHILLEPFRGSDDQQYLDFIFGCVQRHQPGVVATIFEIEGKGASVGAHLAVSDGHCFYYNISSTALVENLLQETRSVLRSGRSRVFSDKGEGGRLSALLEFIPLPVPLVIFGAGPDAVPVVALAKQLDWVVSVIDRRPAFARADRFPGADAVILAEPEGVSSHVRLDSETAVLVMTHHFETDCRYLRQLLESPVAYIGILGPKAKTELLLQTLRKEGFHPTDEQLARLHGPVGLDLGAETPEEIAMAIIAEIQAVRAGHPAGFLRNRSAPIHKRVER